MAEIILITIPGDKASKKTKDATKISNVFLRSCDTLLIFEYWLKINRITELLQTIGKTQIINVVDFLEPFKIYFNALLLLQE